MPKTEAKTVKNSAKRLALYAQEKAAKAAAKKERKAERRRNEEATGAPKPIPQTIEMKRESDEVRRRLPAAAFGARGARVRGRAARPLGASAPSFAC